MNRLPTDIVCHISFFVNLDDLLSMHLTCRSIHDDVSRTMDRRKYEYAYRPPAVTMLGEDWRDRFGKLHRILDLPARIGNSYKMWYKHGNEHRDGDRPAVITITRPRTYTQYWFQNGQPHRDNDKPRIVEVVWFASHGVYRICKTFSFGFTSTYYTFTINDDDLSKEDDPYKENFP